MSDLVVSARVGTVEDTLPLLSQIVHETRAVAALSQLVDVDNQTDD